MCTYRGIYDGWWWLGAVLYVVRWLCVACGKRGGVMYMVAWGITDLRLRR